MYGEVPLENLRTHPVLGSISKSDTLSRSKIFKNNILSLNFLINLCAAEDICQNLSENTAVLPAKLPKSDMRGAIAYNYVTESVMDPVIMIVIVIEK